MLASGQYRRVLAEVYPNNPAADRLRARALFMLGKLGAARAELRIALVLDPDDARTRKQLAEVERSANNRGAELRHLERLRASGDDDRTSRRRLGQLLLQRAAILLSPVFGLQDVKAAERDLTRAVRLDSHLAKEAAELRHTHGTKGAGPAPNCPGIPSIDWLSPLPPIRCTLVHPLSLLDAAADRFVLSACGDARAALELERHGCLKEARLGWERLRQYDDRDPRWPLALARLALAERKIGRAELLLLDYRYLSRDRAAATLLTARLLALAGFKRRGARAAIEALAVSRHAERQLAVVALLVQLGQREAASDAARVILDGYHEPSARAELDRRLARILTEHRPQRQTGGPPSRPGRPPKTPAP